MMNKRIEINTGKFISFSDDSENYFQNMDYTVKRNKDGEIESFNVLITSENYSEVIDALSSFAVFSAISCYMEIFLKGKFDKDKIESIKMNHIESADMEYYYTPLMGILLELYLENNDKINLSSFITFNIPGFKEQLRVLAKFEKQFNGHFLSTTSSFFDDFRSNVETSKNLSSEAFNTMTTKLRKGYEEQGEKPYNDTLYVFMLEGLKLTNKLCRLIDFKYIENETGTVINMTKEDCDINDLEFNLFIISLIFALETFHPDTLIIYKGLDVEKQKIINSNIECYNASATKKVNVFKSNEKNPGGINL